METFLIVVGVLAFVGVVVVVSLHFERKRTEQLRQLAADLGLTFHGENDGLIVEFSGFNLFSQGHSKKLKNLMQQAGDPALFVFDYQYTTGSGKNSSTWSQTVVALSSPRLALSSFVLRPEGFFDKIGQVFGYQDIDFDSHAEFSRRYILRGQDETGIRDTFRDPVLDHFEREAGKCLEGGENRLVYYRASRRVAVDKVEGFLAEALDVFKLFAQEVS